MESRVEKSGAYNHEYNSPCSKKIVAALHAGSNDSLLMIILNAAKGATP